MPWDVKVWKFKKDLSDYSIQKAAMDKWIGKFRNKYQINVIFVSNGFAVEYRPLRRIY